MRVRCVTINVKALSEGWFESRVDAIVRGLRALSPDVLALQESAVRHRPAYYDQAAAIGAALDLPTVAFGPYANPNEVPEAEQHGLAILSRWPLRAARLLRLPTAATDPSDARAALWVSVDTPKGRLHVGTVHLSWRPEQGEMRYAQAKLVLDHAECSGWLAPGARTVLLGDWNETETEPAVGLTARMLCDAFRSRHPDLPGHTWVAANPLTGCWPFLDRRLDYIFCDRAARVVESSVVLDQPAPQYPSDHFGVFADLDWDAADTIEPGKV